MLRTQSSNGLIKCISHALQWLMPLMLVGCNCLSGGLHHPFATQA